MFDQLAEGDTDRCFDHAGSADSARQAEQSAIGPAALGDDGGHVHQRLDVVHRGRLPEESRLEGERWLVARFAAVALDRIEDRGLLATDVGARTANDLHVEAGRRSEVSGGAASLDRRRERLVGAEVLAAQIHPAELAPDGEARDP